MSPYYGDDLATDARRELAERTRASKRDDRWTEAAILAVLAMGALLVLIAFL